MYRQGDVLIVPCDSIPDGTKPVKRDAGRVVLAYGEATGHAHAITEKRVTLREVGADRFLRVIERACLRHEEHAPIEIPPGCYKIIRQREYHPEEIRNVAD